MRYHLRNLNSGTERLCSSVEEAHQKVNDIVAGGEEWVIIRLPEQRVGVGVTVSSGIGPI